MNILRSLCLSLPLLAAPAAGQCQFNTVTVQSYGNACNPVFQTVPTLAARLDTTTCTLHLVVTAFTGCCNTFLRDRLLAIGVTSTLVPLPFIGPGCELLVDPFTILFLPANLGDTFRLSIPPGIPSFTFFAQGAAHYFTTIGFRDDLALTAGAMLTLM